MFRRVGLPCLLGAALLVSACKKSQETAPATPAPDAAAPAKPAELAPVVDDSLSFVEKAGDQCKWVRLDAVAGTRKTVFSFAGPCQLAQLAWSHDGRKGAVLQTFEDERPPRAWTVELATGQGTALTLPGVGRTTELGFDPEGRPVALVAHHEIPNTQAPERVEENGQASFVFEGQKYPINIQDGEPGLAHAYRREGDAWKRVETLVTSYGWDMAGETQILESAKRLGPNTRLEAQAGVESENASDQETAALEKTVAKKQAEPSGAEGEEEEPSWARFSTAGGPVYYREKQVENVIPSLPLRWNVGDKLAEPEKLALPEGAAISLATRGNVLLVTSNEAVRLYDVKQKKQVVSLNGVSQAGFWPRPGAASARPTASAGDKESPKALSMKLNEAQAALDFLKQSGMKLKEGKESCADLAAEHGSLGSLVKKAQADATDSSIQCEPNTEAKTWACKAEFTKSGGDEDSEFAIQLQYSVDDATRSIQAGSLVCLIAG